MALIDNNENLSNPNFAQAVEEMLGDKLFADVIFMVGKNKVVSFFWKTFIRI